MIDLLSSEISKDFPAYSRKQVHNFIILTLCLFKRQTVCLNKLKGTVGSVLEKPEVRVDSHYRRLIRIINNPFPVVLHGLGMRRLGCPASTNSARKAGQRNPEHADPLRQIKNNL